MKTLAGLALAAAALSACTQKNPNLCCTDAANCEAQGLGSDAMCSDGLICRGNQCVAETCSSSDECEAGAPFCAGNGLCAMACDADTECPGFGGSTANVYCQNGACVECRADADCSTDLPVCDGGSCRGCQLDSECASGACGDTGKCVAPSAILYVSTTGTDAGTCTQSSPCATISFAFPQATTARSHIVLAAGMYSERVYVAPGSTTATVLSIHGGGAMWTTPSGGEGGLLDVFDVGLKIQNVGFVGATVASPLIQLGSVPSTIDHVTFSSGYIGVAIVHSSLTVHDSQFVNMNTGINVAGSLTLDRVTMRGGTKPIADVSGYDNQVNITNLVVYDQTDAVHLENSTGTVQFSTFGDANTGATALVCSNKLTVDSSIVWNTVGPTVNGACLVRSSIVGPAALAGIPNTDPKFVNALQRDYHLGPGSPARDMVDSGPPTDFEGDARPQGPKFDIGADEAK